MFINRHKEMEHLNKEYCKTESSFIVIFSKSGFTEALKSLSSYFEEGDNLNYLVVSE